MLIKEGKDPITCMDKTGYKEFETEDPIEAMRMLLWYGEKVKPNNVGCSYQLAMTGGYTLVPGVIV
jgi:hypothetical protein